jgi:hypothetical protein
MEIRREDQRPQAAESQADPDEIAKERERARRIHHHNECPKCETPPYATVVKLAGSNEPWPPADAWSLVVEKVEESDPYTWEAEVGFLVDDAPVELLTSGRSFELYEGKKRVAVGTLQ